MNATRTKLNPTGLTAKFGAIFAILAIVGMFTLTLPLLSFFLHRNMHLVLLKQV